MKVLLGPHKNKLAWALNFFGFLKLILWNTLIYLRIRTLNKSHVKKKLNAPVIFIGYRDFNSIDVISFNSGNGLKIFSNRLCYCDNFNTYELN